MEWVSTCWIVGVYRPVCVESAMLISAWVRMVTVGFEEDDGNGVMEDRRRGHSSIDLESVFRRIGR
jgi:hypothetical protein